MKRNCCLWLLLALAYTMAYGQQIKQPSGVSALSPSETKGHLFIVGGGSRPDYLMQKFIELGGGNRAKVLVVPFASEVPVEVGKSQSGEFLRLGCASSSYIFCPKDSLDSPKYLAVLDSVTAVFFSGGDQNQLTSYLLGSKFLDKIKSIYAKGGVVGGTSAGAAVMSQVMITGKERLNEGKDGSFEIIKLGNVDVAPGLGFIQSAIVDQHFLVRKRQNRLINLVIEHPDLKGIGIDESTAIVVRPNGTFVVEGESGVMVFENMDKSDPTPNSKGYLPSKKISLKLLLAGDEASL